MVSFPKSKRLRISDTAKKHCVRFCDQLLIEGVGYAEGMKLMRAVFMRQAVVGCKGVRVKAAKSLGVDRKYLIETYHSDSIQLFPEDVEAEIERLRQRAKQ